MLTLTRWEIHPRDGSPPIRGDVRMRGETAPRTAVVICHGFKGFKDWGFFPELAQAVARRGHAAVSFNFAHSGVGADGQDFSALDLFAENTHSRNADEIRMVIDAVTTGGLLSERPARVGLFGHSRGGGEAIIAAAEDVRVDALVTWSAIASVERWSPEQIDRWERGETVEIANSRTGQQMPMHPGFWQDIQRNRQRLDIARAAAAVESPWLIVHGTQDESVAAADAETLWKASGERAALLRVEDAGHTFGAVHPFTTTTPQLEQAEQATLDWFDRHLAAGG